MPVNFGILSPLQNNAPTLQGSAPSLSPRPVRDPVNELSNGFLDAYQKGQQIQNSNLQNQVGQQNLQQETMKTNQMQQDVKDASSIREGAQQGADQYIKALIATGKQPEAVEFQTRLISQQKANADAKTADAQSYSALTGAQGLFWSRVQMGSTNPDGTVDQQKAQSTFNMLYPDLPSSIKKTIPEQYSQNNMMAGMTIHALDLADAAAKNPSEAKTELGKTQQDADRVEGIIAKRKAQGLDTTQQEVYLKQLQTAAADKAAPKADPKMAAATKDWTDFKTGVAKGATNYQDLSNLINESRTDSQGGIPTSPLTGFIRGSTAAGDKLNKDSNKLQTEVIKQMVSSGLSRMDIPIVKMVQQSAPGNNHYQATNAAILDKYEAANEISGNILPKVIQQLEAAGITDRTKAQDLINRVVTNTGAFKKDGSIDLKALGGWQAELDKITGKTTDSKGQPSPSAAPQVIPEGRITITSPDGTVGHIPQAQLQAAIAAGYKPTK